MNISRRITLLGCPVDCITSGDLLERLKCRVIERSAPIVIQFVNANKVSMVKHDISFGNLLTRSDYVLADGMPMLPMAALLGLYIPERIDGIGLMKKLLHLAHNENFSIYLLGARQDTVQKCVNQITMEYPGLTIAGFRNGYFSDDEIPEIAAQIRALSPDFLFLGIGSPIKERFADEWKDELGARVIQGVGGTFDVMAGLVKRAPKWMQYAGMEWLHRVIQEPRRMFWRYFHTNCTCLLVFFNAFGIRWKYITMAIISCHYKKYQYYPMFARVANILGNPARYPDSLSTVDLTSIRRGLRRYIQKVILFQMQTSISRSGLVSRIMVKLYTRGGRSAFFSRQTRNR